MKTQERFTEITAFYKSREDVRAFVNLFLTLSAVVVFAIFAIKPTAVTVTKLNREIKTKKETIASMNTKIQNLEKAQNLWSKEARRIEIVARAIPSDPEFDKQLRQIEGLAQKNQVSIVSLRIGGVSILGATGTQGEQSINYNFDVVGDFKGIAGFVGDLERMRRPFVVDSLFLEKGEEDLEGDLRIGITGTSPYYVK